MDAKELALQLIDIVTLRPEIQLCHVGILTKCFQIEPKPHERSPGRSPAAFGNAAANGITNGILSIDLGAGGLPIVAPIPTIAEDVDSSTDVDDDDDDDDQSQGGAGGAGGGAGETTDGDDTDDDGTTPASVVDLDETQSEGSAPDGQEGAGHESDTDSLADAEVGSPVQHFQLKDMASFDEKVAIFKARLGYL
jgi:hypothetical protein